MRPLLVLSLLLVPWALSLGGGGDDKLHAGFAQADITPEIGKTPVYLAGFGKNRKATGVHDPLMARAVVLKHDGKKIAIVSVDLVGLFLPFVEGVRKKLPGFEHVLVSSTHNHEGPDTMGLSGASFFQTGIDPAYMKKVEQGIVDAVTKADKQARPVTAKIGTAAAPELLHDGRKPIVKHDELVAVRFFDGTDKSAGIIVQWNCHPETLNDKNTLISADYVHATVDHLQHEYSCPVVYLTGTVGGLMTSLHVPVKDEKGMDLKDGTFEKTERFGKLVGKVADKALARAVPAKLTPFDIRTRNVFLPIDNTLYKVAWKLGVLERQGYVWTGDPYDAKPGNDPDKQRLCVRSEIGYLKLGELEVAAIPGEIYPELVLSKVEDPAVEGADYPDAAVEPGIYAQLKAPYRMIVGLANDEIGYILPKRQWDDVPPFCYGRKTKQYGEVNSLGPETGPILCEAFRALVAGKK